MSQKCSKIVFSVPPETFWTFPGHLLDIFRTFCGHSLLLGGATICPLQLKPNIHELNNEIPHRDTITFAFAHACTHPHPLGPPACLPARMQREVTRQRNNTTWELLDYISSGNSRRILFVIISSWLTSRENGRIIFRNAMDFASLASPPLVNAECFHMSFT